MKWNKKEKYILKKNYYNNSYKMKLNEIINLWEQK